MYTLQIRDFIEPLTILQLESIAIYIMFEKSIILNIYIHNYKFTMSITMYNIFGVGVILYCKI